MEIEQTKRNTYKLMWRHGELEVNAIPANGALPSSQYARAGSNGQLIYLHDNVGIVALRINGCPHVPRICWDNREHHFWQGFNGGFRPRNTVVNDIRISQFDEDSSISVSFYYIADAVKTTLSWLFSEPSDDGSVSWDTFFSFENLSSVSLQKYMTFFACYHDPGKNYYWNSNNEIAECTDSFSGYSNEEKMRRNAEVTAAFREQVKGWTAGIANPSISSEIYGSPVLLSETRGWFGQGRHVLMVEPSKCLRITSAMRQAFDYMLAPDEMDLLPDGVFTARVRHIIARIDGMNDLRPRWDKFLDDIAMNNQDQPTLDSAPDLQR
ncbi:hypothetical protein ACFL6S_04255 [Candidatus Poribacteria bacterium]